MAFQIPITIDTALKRIQKRDYVLPAIQREFVWSTGQICALFDSLMRGYPIGSFLFWKVHSDQPLLNHPKAFPGTASSLWSELSLCRAK